ncbi:MAG: ATP/GTP-binding protein [Ilumatobacter sp.]|uniref:GTP-binding protein n=1 Tax=Ilumatobacter sp. TaxID=1967498 RepID=UPI0026043068|nr:ATP/GTP-binding protein [Ilumatobacter sp.]MDJ0771737.1 ATP/GTP-binding protein [Ilumatobacter sp.]
MTAHADARAGHVFKVLVTGPFAAGKTSLIQAVSQTTVVETDVVATGAEAEIKQFTTVAMDFGTYAIEDGDVQLLMFGTPGQSRFRFMTDIMKGDVDVVVYVVDAEADHTHAEAGEAMRELLADLRVPLVVAVNRCDDRDVAVLVARQLGALASEAVVPCQLIEHESGRKVVIEALLAVLDRLERTRDELLEPVERVLALAGAA